MGFVLSFRSQAKLVAISLGCKVWSPHTISNLLIFLLFSSSKSSIRSPIHFSPVPPLTSLLLSSTPFRPVSYHNNQPFYSWFSYWPLLILKHLHSQHPSGSSAVSHFFYLSKLFHTRFSLLKTDKWLFKSGLYIFIHYPIWCLTLFLAISFKGIQSVIFSVCQHPYCCSTQ